MVQMYRGLEKAPSVVLIEKVKKKNLTGAHEFAILTERPQWMASDKFTEVKRLLVAHLLLFLQRLELRPCVLLLVRPIIFRFNHCASTVVFFCFQV